MLAATDSHISDQYCVAGEQHYKYIPVRFKSDTSQRWATIREPPIRIEEVSMKKRNTVRTEGVVGTNRATNRFRDTYPTL